MAQRQFLLAFLGICALTCAAFVLKANAEEAKKIPAPPPVASSDTMNGYALKDYDGFWKDPANWHFVTVRFRKDTGEMRLTYANDIAWKALLAGGRQYPDGAVFGKIGLLTRDDPSFTSSAVPVGARRYQLMVRDAKKWQETNGWGYALFDGAGKAVAEDQDIASMACYACHALVPERGDVFSEPFQLDVSSGTPVPAVASAVRRSKFKASRPRCARSPRGPARSDRRRCRSCAASASSRGAVAGRASSRS